METPSSEYIRKADILKRFPVSRRALDYAIKRGRFPAPALTFCGHTHLFRAIDVEAWLEEQTATAQRRDQKHETVG